MMDIDIEEPESKKRRVNMGAEEKRKDDEKTREEFRQKNKKSWRTVRIELWNWKQ